METVKNFIKKYPEISSKVFLETDKYASDFNDDDRVTNKIIKRLAKYFETRVGGDKHTKRIYFIIYREISQAQKEFSERKYYRETQLFSTLMVLDGGGTPIEYEPTDVLADVEEVFNYRESERGINEKIARLATDDRQKVILKAWSDGIYITKEIAGILANTLGGNIQAHIRYIDRFKEKCEESISTIQEVLAS